MRSRSQRLQTRVADKITTFAGSMAFVYIHMVWFAAWIVLRPEAFPFGLLTMIVSLEAIFLATFVMISQNRADEKRQVLADQQWELVQDEGAQNESLIAMSQQILELTKKVHVLVTDHSKIAAEAPDANYRIDIASPSSETLDPQGNGRDGPPRDQRAETGSAENSHSETWEPQWTALAQGAHWQLMSPTDWERFFAFVHECDRTSSTLSRQDVRAMIEIHSPGLIEAGNWLADFYEFGRKLLEAGPNPEAHRTRLTTLHEDSYLG